MAELKRGEPLLVLGAEEHKILQRLLTQVYKPYDTAAGLSRLFITSDFQDGEWQHKERRQCEIPRSAMKRHITDMRRAIRQSEAILDELDRAITDAKGPSRDR